jgi:hypothetical protein
MIIFAPTGFTRIVSVLVKAPSIEGAIVVVFCVNGIVTIHITFTDVKDGTMSCTFTTAVFAEATVAKGETIPLITHASVAGSNPGGYTKVMVSVKSNRFAVVKVQENFDPATPCGAALRTVAETDATELCSCTLHICMLSMSLLVATANVPVAHLLLDS